MAAQNVGMSIEEKGKLILEDRKQSNLLVDLLCNLASEDVDEVSRSIVCLEGVFKVFLSKRIWSRQIDNENDRPNGTKGQADTTSKKGAEKIYAEWLHGKYLVFVTRALELLAGQDKGVQKKALGCLMRLVLAESEANAKNPSHDATKSFFSIALFSRITDTLILGKCANTKGLLKAFSDYLSYEDIQFYTLKSIDRVINRKSRNIVNKGKAKNDVCLLLLTITSGRQIADENEIKLFVNYQQEDTKKFSWQSKEKMKLFSKTWLSFLQLNLPRESLKKILNNLHQDVMPYMEDPRMLIDFLTDAYDMEGPVALLAMNGLFILIHQYNLDYPEFFKKLYYMVDAKIFDVKYRSRFFILADLFLTSTNLPAYLVAAFVKRLARVSLRAPPDGIKIALVLIENLLKRHPSCRVLIHRKNQKSSGESKTDLHNDPYNYDETDPAICNALSSSLWELKTLEQHYHPDIQEAVKVFQNPFTKEEKDVNEIVDESYSELFNEELMAYEKEDRIPLAFKPAVSLFGKAANDENIWCFD